MNLYRPRVKSRFNPITGWVARMMGHTSLKMIYDHYYSYIKNYQSEVGKRFMESVYNPIMKVVEKSTPILPHQEKRGVSDESNPL